MAINVVLAVVVGDASDQRTLATAAVAGRQIDAVVDVVHLKPDPTEMVMAMGEASVGLVAQQIIAAAEADIAARAKQARAYFDAWKDEAGVKTSYRETVGSGADSVARLGRLADVIVVARAREDGGGDLESILESALVSTGRPVLLAPEKSPASLTRHVGIAWNGSAEAARAVAAVLPFARGAARVTVFAASEDDTLGEGADALIAYLDRHGIKADVANVPGSAAAAGDALADGAVAAGVDLLAMGAYSHSRLRRLIFGGATRRLMSDDRLAVLMAH